MDKIKELERIEEKTIKTICKFDFMTEPVVISHFQPKDEDAIMQGCMNRYESELRAFNEPKEVLVA